MPVNDQQFRVLYIASEAAPFVKIGGLGDVAGTLPPVLARLRADEIDGHQIDIRLVIPYHPTVAKQYPFTRAFTSVLLKRQSGDLMMRVFETELAGMPVYLIDGDLITAAKTVYSFQPEEDMPKFAAFSMAALQLAKMIGFKPHIVNANDWHTALAVYALHDLRRHDPFFRHTRSVFTVHNLPYMGAECRQILVDYGFRLKLNLSLPRWARSFCMPLGLISADHINAVSPTYAAEIQTPAFGCSLENFLSRRKASISGIINGLDYQDWNPGTDPQVAFPYDVKHLALRKKNKAALQKEFNLDQDEDCPLIILVSRMDHQKGMDVAFEGLRQVHDLRWQAAILGTGAEQIENDARLLEQEFPDRVRAVIRFDGKLARRMYAGGDMILLPSNYEPCGLTQLISMRYGCVPVAHATGGFVDTIADSRQHEAGTGFLFTGNTPARLAEALRRAFETYRQPEQWQQLQENGMRQDFSWHRSALQYFHLYQQVYKGARG